MNGKYQFGWIIKIISKDEQGFQMELADLGNGKHMVVATDTSNPISENVYRQAGFGPFILKDDVPLETIYQDLKEHLLTKRTI